MQNFEECVHSWLCSYLEQHEDDEELIITMLSFMGYRADDIPDDEEYLDFLLSIDVKRIYWFILSGYSDAFVTETESKDFRRKTFMQAVDEKEFGKCDVFSLSYRYIQTMVNGTERMDSLYSYFQMIEDKGVGTDLSAELFNYTDCRNLYILYMDEMEAIKDYVEQTAKTIYRPKGIPRYAFMCRFCFEELASSIARNLFPDKY